MTKKLPSRWGSLLLVEWIGRDGFTGQRIYDVRTAQSSDKIFYSVQPGFGGGSKLTSGSSQSIIRLVKGLEVTMLEISGP